MGRNLCLFALCLASLMLVTVPAGWTQDQALVLKVAVIDMGKVTENYQALQTKNQSLLDLLDSQQQYLDQLKEFLFLSAENFTQIIELLKAPDPLSAEEQQRLEELRTLAANKEKEFLDLRSKPNRTTEENDTYLTLLDLSSISWQRIQALDEEFTEEYNTQVGVSREYFMELVRKVAEAVVNQEGYDLALDAGVVLVGGTDITDQVLEHLNAGTMPAGGPGLEPQPTLEPPASPPGGDE